MDADGSAAAVDGLAAGVGAGRLATSTPARTRRSAPAAPAAPAWPPPPSDLG